MKLPRFLLPLKWFYRAHIWGLRYRLRYCRLFASAVWHWDSCAYGPTMKLMEIAFREISKLHREHGLVVDSPKIARQTLTVAELCRRLGDDNYEMLAGYHRYDQMTEKEKRAWAKHTDYLAQQDTLYLGKMLRRVRWWWQ